MRQIFSFLFIILFGLIIHQSCRHDPTQIVTGAPCHPDTVYFRKDILPLLRSSCAKAGCHDAASAADDVVLTSFSTVMQTAEVRPGNPDNSKLYKVLIETNPSKRMPPPPLAALTPQQIEAIRKWILQGAKDIICNEN